MSDLLKAADEIGKLTKMFSALESVKPFLSKLGSLEQACAEAKAKLDESIAESAKVKADIAATKKLLDDAKKATAAELSAGAAERDKAQNAARTILGAAEVEAKSLRYSAAGYLAAEQAKEKAVLADLEAKKKKAAAELADIEKRTAAAQETLQKLAARV